MTAPRRKKRVRPSRRIVPRGRMGLAWVVGSLLLGAIILVVGIVFVVIEAN